MKTTRVFWISMNMKVNELEEYLKLKIAAEKNDRKKTVTNRILIGLYILLVIIGSGFFYHWLYVCQ